MIELELIMELNLSNSKTLFQHVLESSASLVEELHVMCSGSLQNGGRNVEFSIVNTPKRQKMQ